MWLQQDMCMHPPPTTKTTIAPRQHCQCHLSNMVCSFHPRTINDLANMFQLVQPFCPQTTKPYSPFDIHPASLHTPSVLQWKSIQLWVSSSVSSGSLGTMPPHKTGIRLSACACSCKTPKLPCAKISCKLRRQLRHSASSPAMALLSEHTRRSSE